MRCASKIARSGARFRDDDRSDRAAATRGGLRATDELTRASPPDRHVDGGARRRLAFMALTPGGIG